ncbi:futalosine synthase [Amycolatopsis tolypomycina]|uniref:Chorismate dehydratase n=1 Tax=Amycolatopsis tolypomycina TaxID=208445 RepID=A0A1H4VWB4_9PSEU|nr:chorismate mutase [Amycolatopsis tolypomycina]SEC84778.1 futalosine synthase [Amycolatopsis tolypomycina]
MTAQQEHAPVTPARNRIDDLDAKLIALITERRRISAGIQRDRIAAGGVRTDTAREREIFRRYHDAFGSAGTTLGSMVLEICRGRLGAERERAAAVEPGREPDTPPLRLGVFSFANCGAVRWGLGDRQVATGTPEAMAAALLAGEVDVAPISLVEYLRHHDRLLALPDLGIGSDGEVLSCQLFTRGPLTDLDGGRVALGSTSRTAALLATILLAEWAGVNAEYRVEPPVLADMLRGADGAVLIGDAALAETLHPHPGLHVHDLGALWREWTGLPMVFAVWAVRRATALRRPAAVSAAHATLLEAAQQGSRQLDEVAESLAANGLFTREEMSRYLATLEHSLGGRHIAGIRHFAKLAARRGAVPDDADITFFGGQS